MAKSRKKATARKPKLIPLRVRTDVEAGRVLSCSQPMIYKYRRRADWPFGPRWPESGVAAEDLVAWKARTIEPAQLPDEEHGAAAAALLKELSPERRARVALVVERATLLRLQRMVQEGQYVAVADVERKRVAQLLALREALLDIGPGLADQLAGASSAEAERLVTTAIAAALNRLAGEPDESNP